jgi:hypothetical protein
MSRNLIELPPVVAAGAAADESRYHLVLRNVPRSPLLFPHILAPHWINRCIKRPAAIIACRLQMPSVCRTDALNPLDAACGLPGFPR